MEADLQGTSQEDLPTPHTTVEVLQGLRDQSLDALRQVIVPEGIYASVENGGEGPYHAFFGRDGAETFLFLVEALKWGGAWQLTRTAFEAQKNFATWQGQKYDPETGERFGALPHEVRFELGGEMSNQQHGAGTNEKPWYVRTDENGGQVLLNWDSNDSTPLWVLSMVRGHRAFDEALDEATDQRVRAALGWIRTNLAEHGGLLGFTGAGYQEGRVYSGLNIQTWMDTPESYTDAEGRLLPYPIKDVLVNTEAWTALQEAADFYAALDLAYAIELQDAADDLKKAINDYDTGFVNNEYDTGLAFAIDGEGNRLDRTSVNQAAVLWTRTEKGELVISDELAEKIGDVALSSDMLYNPHFGLRDFKRGTEFATSTEYHASDTTYWPFIATKAAIGLLRAGRTEDAQTVMWAILTGVLDAGQNIEMFKESDENGEMETWHHPDKQIIQASSVQQTWTAAAVYAMITYLNRHIDSEESKKLEEGYV